MVVGLVDQADEQAGVAGLLRDLHATAGDPRKQLRRLVSFTCRFYGQAGDIVEIARGAGCTNEDLLALWQGGEGGGLPRPKALADAWGRAGVLPQKPTPKEARGFLWGQTGTDHYSLFVVGPQLCPT